MNATQSIVEAIPKIVEILVPLAPEERQRAISAALIVLGEPAKAHETRAQQGRSDQPVDIPNEGISPKATSWMRKNQITRDQLDHVFSIDEEGIDVIASRLPGKSRRQQTLEAYVLCGVTALLRSGEPNFANLDARKLCQRVGCYDAANHSNYLKGFGNLIHGSKDSGWKLTNPGLNEAARIIRQLTEMPNS